ncbi:hypothetical protein EDB85DRAFT_2072802 [Lactarius pseudohatsudake]|nr:hypothetical protein EDB85DRAFT_2072802 [Lactarius pseudohatsudake]
MSQSFIRMPPASTVGYKYKTCQKCCDISKRSMQKKRKRKNSDEGPPHRPAEASNCDNLIEDPESDTSDDNKRNVPIVFQDHKAIMKQLKNVFKMSECLFFHGRYNRPLDPLISEKDYVKQTAYDIWKVTGYRFQVKDNVILANGHKTRHWCCQDKDRKQRSRPSQKEGAKHRDTLGMRRYDCKSKLNISCRTNSSHGEMTRTITIWLKHLMGHIPYYDVALPLEAAEMIREGLDWTTPNEMVRRIHITYPAVSTKQVHKAWSTMSETLYHQPEQYEDEVDLLTLPTMDGVEQVAWVMKKIVKLLRGKIVEIGIDATYNTNSRHLELYTVLGEYDNTGFPLSYCLLTTASSIEEGKHLKARRTWADVKHQLCWWHLREATKRRLKGNLPTSIYHPQRAMREHPFIDPTFKPHGRVDLDDTEGHVPGEVYDVNANLMPYNNPNSINAISARIHSSLAIRCQLPKGLRPGQ